MPPRVFGVLVGWLLASTGGDGTGDGMVVFVTRGVVYGARCFGSGCAVGVLRSALLYSCVSDRDGLEATKASMSGEGSVHVDAFSGFVSGVTALCVSQPFDTVRVRAQTIDYVQPRPTIHARGVSSASSSFVVAAQHTFAASRSHLYHTILGTFHGYGVLGFYRGFFPPLVSTAVVSTTVFSTFGYTKRCMQSCAANTSSQQLPLPLVFLSGSISGACTSLLTTPIHRVKVQLQTTAHGAFARKGHTLKSAMACALQIFRQEGLHGGMYKGWRAQALSETVGRGVYFGTYETVKRLYMRSSENRAQYRQKGRADQAGAAIDGCPLPVRMLAGALSGVVGWVVVYPVDVIKNRAQAEAIGVGPAGHYRSVFQTGRNLYHRYGLRIFYRGLSVMLVRAFPVSATALPVYDCVHDWLSKQQSDDMRYNDAT